MSPIPARHASHTTTKTNIRVSAHGKQVLFDLPDPRDHIQRIVQQTGNFYELPLLEDIFGRVHCGLAIDVGAHIGNHTLWFAGVMNLEVIALEPNPKSYLALERHVKINRLGDRVRTYPVAAGDRRENGTLVDRNPANSGMTQCVPKFGGEVTIFKVDDLPLLNSKVTLLKIDVEGSEIAVLRGAAKTIEQFRPLIYAEAADPAAQEALLSYMYELGYVKVGMWAKTPVLGFVPAEKLPATTHTLSTAIMAHPARAGQIPALLTALNTPTSVVLDRLNDRWDTGRRALLAYDPRCTHHVVIQDDAVIPADLLPVLQGVLQVIPAHHPIVLYLGKVGRYIKRIAPAVKPHTSWVRMPGINWGVGLVFPTKDIQDLVAFCDQRPEPNYDLRISRFYEEKKIDAWYPVPSLVDHLDAASLVPGRNGGRHAWRYVGPRASEFDPYGEVVRVDITR